MKRKLVRKIITRSGVTSPDPASPGPVPLLYCMCGRLAAFRLRVRCLDASLEEYHYGTLYLCEPCYRLEVESCLRAAQLPPYVGLLTPPDLVAAIYPRRRSRRRRPRLAGFKPNERRD